MKVADFVYSLERTQDADCTPAYRGAVTFRRAKKAGWAGSGAPIPLRRQWQEVVQRGREQAREWWG